MKKVVSNYWTALILVGLLTGCASFNTKQTDISYDENGKTQRAITTKASATTVFDSKSALASFKAQQTDKTQSASVGSLVQEATSTNLGPNLDAVTRLIEAVK